MKEIWNDIKEYKGLYQISNFGRVKSFYNNKEGSILKPYMNNYGYMSVKLYKNKISKNFKIHKLVAETFIPNINNYPCINHKDENKQNNKVDNLEWCTYKYNNNYGTMQKRKALKQSKKINQYDLDGKFIKTWNGMREIERELHINNVCIWKCCKGMLKQAKGYIWRYYDK